MSDTPAENLDDILNLGHRLLEHNDFETLQNETLRLVQGMLNAKSSVFLSQSHSLNNNEFDGGAAHDVSKSSMLRWCSDYQAVDPVVNHYVTHAVDNPCNVVLSSEVIGSSEYLASEIYNDFLKPLSIYHILLVGLGKTGSHLGILGFHRTKNQSAFADEDVRKAKLLAPYISVAFSEAIAIEKVKRSEWLVETLIEDSPYSGIIVLNQVLEPIFMNEHASSVLKSLQTDRKADTKQFCNSLPEELYKQCRLAKSRLEGTDKDEQRQYQPIAFDTEQGPIYLHLRPILCQTAGIRYLICIGSSSKPHIWSQRLKYFNLTKREIDIVQLVSSGLRNNQIAETLFVSVRTVENHLHAIYEKVGVNSRTALIHRVTSLN